MKKILILLCAIMATIAANAYEFTVGGLGYTPKNQNECYVEGLAEGRDNGVNSIEIPETVTYYMNDITYTVTSIADNAFRDFNTVTSLTIPNSVTSIGRSAFENCSGLFLVEIPNSVTSIGDFAFSGCRNIGGITIPESVTSIGTGVFKGADIYKFYGKYASDDNRCLIVDGTLNSFAHQGTSSYSIPTTVTSIGDYAFYECFRLTSVTIPNSVISIGIDAFCGCSGLEAFYGKYASADNRCLIVDGSLIVFAPSGLSTYSIPNSVSSIHDYVFYNCSGLTEVTIPTSVTSIGEYAFYNCGNLTSVTIPNSVTTIGKAAFRDCRNLTEVTIPNSVTSIADNAFYRCYSLTNVIIPTTVTSIGREAFYYCCSLTSLTIPNSVTSIGGWAFENCEGLTSVTVNNSNPDNISLGYDSFHNVPTTTCILYVPKGSKALYEAADQWKNFQNIVEFELVSLTDGEAYTATEGLEDVDVNYTRTFNNTEWQPLYVPFNMSYEEWSEYADVAEVYNVRAYDTDNDEKIDDIAIEFNKLTSGEIVPNIPYVIRAKSTGTVTFECSGKTMLAAPEEEGTIECSSTKMTYSFHGVYQPKTDLYSSGVYHLSDGAFRRAKSDAAVLSPNRFYLKITPKTGGYNPSSLPQKIRVIVDGEEVTTGIEDIEIDTPSDGIYYDLTGRQVKNPTRGIYIQNGNKVIIK